MKRVVLDHCVPKRVKQAVAHCEVATAYRLGWNELKNGSLLEAAERAGFDVLITADKNLQYQQHLGSRRIAIVELPTNALPALLPKFPAIGSAVDRIGPGGYIAVV